MVDEAASSFQHEPRVFSFARNVRRSVLLTLGLHQHHGDDSNPNPIVEAYSKASDKDAVQLYLAIVLGLGGTRILKVFGQAGYVYGFIGLVVFTLLQYFILCRIVEVPHLLELNLETYTDIAKSVLPRPVANVFLAVSILSWLCLCILFLKVAIISLSDLIIVMEWGGEAPAGVTFVRCAVFCGLFVMLFIWKDSAKALRRNAKRVWQVTLFLLFWEIGIGAYFYFLWNPDLPPAKRREIQYVDSKEWTEIFSGWKTLLICFIGVGIFPFIAADMLEPANVKKVIRTSCIKIFFYYLVGAMPYFFWGNTLLQDRNVNIYPTTSWWIFKTSLDDISIFRLHVSLHTFLFLVKAGLSFPIVFWPLVREIEQFMSLENTTAMELGLPWAHAQRMRMRALIRVGLVLLVMLPFFFYDRGDAGETSRWQEWYRHIQDFAEAVIINIIHIMFPGIFALIALITSLAMNGKGLPGCVQRCLSKCGCISQQTPDIDRNWTGASWSMGPIKSIPYMCKSSSYHLFITLVIVLSITTFSWLVVQDSTRQFVVFTMDFFNVSWPEAT